MKMSVSRRANEMQESPIRKLIPLATSARKRGLTVYPLNIGQPDIPTPLPIRDAIRNFDKTVLAYSPSPGEDYLLEAFSAYYKFNKIPLEPSELIVTTGGSEAIFFAFLAICNPNDEVLVFEPFYTNYNGIASETGIVLKPIQTVAEDGFQLPSLEIIENSITKKTRGILICNPNNPTGTVYSRSGLEGLAKLAKKYNLYLLADEVYREFTYDGLKHTSILHLSSDTFENSILIDSISKRYSSCGARIGVIASKNRDVISSSLKFAQARLSSPTIEQWAARAGLLMDHSYFDPILKEYQARRDTVMHGFSKIPGVICKTPHGAFYVIAKLPIQNAEAFARWLLTDFEHNGETVLLAPAQGFYATPNLGTSEVRISYVLETEKLKKAMTALGAGVKAFQSYEKTQVPVEAKKKVSFGNEENNSKSDSYTSSFRRTME